MTQTPAPISEQFAHIPNVSTDTGKAVADRVLDLSDTDIAAQLEIIMGKSPALAVAVGRIVFNESEKTKSAKDQEIPRAALKTLIAVMALYGSPEDDQPATPKPRKRASARTRVE